MITDMLSIASFAVEICDKERVKGIGTAFFIRKSDELFLITNWHIVTNRNAFTKESMSSWTPSKLLVLVPILKDGKVTFEQWSVSLTDELGRPQWIEHSLLKSHNVDIVSIKVPNREGAIAVNEIPSLRSIRVSIGDEVTINGFPLELRFGPYPIFKKGFIASEPNIDLNKLPIILVDTATRAGMSGSPVFLTSNNSYTEDITNDTVMDCGRFYKFLGIYSGRYGVDETNKKSLHLGIVWKENLIEELLSH